MMGLHENHMIKKFPNSIGRGGLISLRIVENRVLLSSKYKYIEL